MDLEDSGYLGFQEKLCLGIQILNWPPGFSRGTLGRPTHFIASWVLGPKFQSDLLLDHDWASVAPLVPRTRPGPEASLSAPHSSGPSETSKTKSGSKRGIQRDPEEQLPQLSSIYNHASSHSDPFVCPWTLHLVLGPFRHFHLRGEGVMLWSLSS